MPEALFPDPRLNFNISKVSLLKFRQIEIFEHHIKKLAKRDIVLIIINAWLVTRLLVSLAVLTPADNVARLPIAAFAIALTGARVIAINKTRFFYASDWHLNDLIAVFSHNRLF